MIIGDDFVGLEALHQSIRYNRQVTPVVKQKRFAKFNTNITNVNLAPHALHHPQHHLDDGHFALWNANGFVVQFVIVDAVFVSDCNGNHHDLFF